MVKCQKKILFFLLSVISFGQSLQANRTVIDLRRNRVPVRQRIVHVPQNHASHPQVIHIPSAPHVVHVAPRPPRLVFAHHSSYVMRPHEAMIVLGTAVIALLTIYWLTRDSYDSYEETNHYQHHHNDQVIVVHDHHYEPDVIIIDEPDDIIIVDEYDDYGDDIIIID
ncbi:MAG TPA: hypothetical protein VGT41_01255 [Candidatus Babeliales bacterium]|nr:hypothetical protein [Candidatus Babeliales bacterium]